LISAIAQTLTRAAHDGRRTLEITIEGGVTHIYEIEEEFYFGALKQILLHATTRKISIARPNEPRSSSFDPVGNPS
jgi:hypothetical protein